MTNCNECTKKEKEIQKLKKEIMLLKQIIAEFKSDPKNHIPPENRI